jgi:membrane associated rhomboid family serine protease
MDKIEINHSAPINASFKNNLKTATGILLLINGLLFIVTILLNINGIDLTDIGGLHFFLAKDFHFYQFVTYLFLHASLWHIFSNLLFLWLFGLVVEKYWGSKRFIAYYLICGIVGGLLQELVQFVSFYLTIAEQDPATSLETVFETGKQLSNELNSWITIGSSSAVCAIILAFGIMFSERQIFSIKVKWLIIIYVFLQVLGFVGSFDNVGIFAAQLGAMLCGFVIICCWNRKSEEIVSDDKKIDWGMKLLLVIVGVNIIYLIINS